VAACGSDSTAPDVPTIEETTFAASLGIDLATFTKNASGLYFKELVVGSGTLAQDGKTVGVRYKGQLPNGSTFDENPAPKAVFSFLLGAGQVVPGFDQGVRGMKIGGKRQVIIPPALGYGSRANGSIPANSILVFTIDLVSVQ
jgi:FKBP-type peptidyl-prolyl cis-trans isomerase